MMFNDVHHLRHQTQLFICSLPQLVQLWQGHHNTSTKRTAIMSTPPGDSNITANDQNPDMPDDLKVDNSYKTRQGDQQPIAVQSDDAPIADNNNVADPDSDQQLGKSKSTYSIKITY